MTSGDAGIARLARVLADIGAVTVDDDAVLVDVDGTRTSVRVLDLGDGLEVVTLTQLVAGGLPNSAELRDTVESRSAAMSFGSMRRASRDDDTVDVLVSYTFPLGELADLPLLTVLHMVLSAGVDARRELAALR